MRGNVADKRCENGHFIDESWDLCPYCPVDENEPEMPIVRPTRFGGADAAKPAAVEPEPPPPNAFSSPPFPLPVPTPNRIRPPPRIRASPR